jgi:hypothetical protein
MAFEDDDSSDDGMGKIFRPLPGAISGISSAHATSSSLPNTFDEESRRRRFDAQVSQAVNDSVFRHSELPIRLPWDRAVSGFPWDRGIHGMIFGSSGCAAMMFTVPRRLPIDPSLSEPVPIQTFLSQSSSKMFRAVVSRIPRVPWPETQLADRHKALMRMRLIIEENPGCTNIGRQLQDAILRLEPDSSLTSIISDSFASKATATIGKRGSCLLKYFVWHRAFCGIAAMPIVEHRFYTFLHGLIAAKAAPTAPASMVSALGFAAHVLEMTGADEALRSLRIKGISQKHFLTKAVKQQSKLLTVLMVLALEDQISIAEDPVDRIASGYFAAQLHSRARFMDLQLAEEIIEDYTDEGDGYIEALSRFIKTSVSMNQKNMLMPLVAPARGIHPNPWAPRWMAERQRQGLDLSKFKCLLPTPGVDGLWHDYPVTSSGASLWLREILVKSGFSASAVEGVSTHSLKSTPLSWCAKKGLDVPTRQLLGHHITSDKISAMTYSRDCQAQPLRAYDEVLRCIRDKEFFPDHTRSGLMVDALDDYAPPRKRTRVASSDLPDHDFQDSVLDSSDSDSSSSTSSISEDDGAEADSEAIKVLSKRKEVLLVVPVDALLYVHFRSNVVHLRLNLNTNKLACNRAISVSYTKRDADRCSLCLKCIQCFSKI